MVSEEGDEEGVEEEDQEEVLRGESELRCPGGRTVKCIGRVALHIKHRVHGGRILVY